jgi:Uma2 family endonuclease
LILAVCLELGIRREALRSTTWNFPFGAGDTAYEADNAYYVQNQGMAKEQQSPDLAIEVVVSHAARKALRAGAFLKIPEMWIFNIPKRRLTFHHLVARGKHKGTYRPQPRSRAFPLLSSAEVLERLDDLETDDTGFHENCRAWARRVLVPRRRAGNGGA